MSSYAFNVTLNNETNTKRDVVEAVIYSRVSNVKGEWAITLDNGKVVWNYQPGTPSGGAGALRIKPHGSDETGYIIAFGYYIASTKKSWIGIVEDLLPTSTETAATAIPKFYGGGQYDKEGKYWSRELNFQKHSNHTGETVAVNLTIDGGNKVVKAVVTIHG